MVALIVDSSCSLNGIAAASLFVIGGFHCADNCHSGLQAQGTRVGLTAWDVDRAVCSGSRAERQDVYCRRVRQSHPDRATNPMLCCRYSAPNPMLCEAVLEEYCTKTGKWTTLTQMSSRRARSHSVRAHCLSELFVALAVCRSQLLVVSCMRSGAHRRSRTL